MADRERQIAAFLAQAGLDPAGQQEVAGDASARRYRRLTDAAGASTILMDAPPDSAGPQVAFAAVARHLRRNGLTAPRIHAADLALGLILMEDLGPTDIAAHLSRQPQDEDRIAGAVVDLLVRLERIPPLPGLPVMTPQDGAEMIAPLFDWYAPTLAPATRAALTRAMSQALADHAGPPVILSLRDFHAGNLIWRAKRQGPDRLGLLDFQDAFGAPAGYDLASWLRDARRDLPEGIAQTTIARYAAATGRQEADVARQVAVLAVQRNLRILGIFARLARRDGKPRYLDLIPRVLGHLRRDLDHPALSPLVALLRPTLPELAEDAA